MKRYWIVLIALAVLAFVIYGSAKNTYNQMVNFEESVVSQWAQVENVYQRRLDLIPNLVNTVKGYADFEQQTLTNVIEARAKASSVNINPQNLDEANMEQFSEAQSGLSSALSRLMVVVERYPDLKANQNFLELQSQLEGTENRISVERRRFNETAQTYNSFIRNFPNNIYAGWFGFESRAYFEADEGASTAPVVEF